MLEKENNTLILSGENVNTIVERYGLNNLMDLLISRLKKAIQNYNPKTTVIPIRNGFNYAGKNPGLVEWMPVHSVGKGVVIKVVGYHPENPKNFNLPTILSSISSYDTQTGHLRGLADGVLLTALRTGAASAVASQVMAKSDSCVLGLIGCGAQSVTQLHALSRVFELKKVMIYDIQPEVMQSFAERMSMLRLAIKIEHSSIDEIVAAADIVCTETSIKVGTGPLFNKIETKPHLHINAVGSDFPEKTELPLELLKKSFVCPDFPAQAKIEGECQQLEDSDIDTDLVDLIQNSSKYIKVKNGLSVFDSTGWALEDQVVMDLFLDLAAEFGIGLEVALENISDDAKNPYNFLLKTVDA